MRRYCIKEGYEHRTEVPHFDDTPYKDEFQLSVYQKAWMVQHDHLLKSVVDVGCGSGFKLLKFFGGLPTVGVEVDPTLSWLRKEYGARSWVRAGKVQMELAPGPRLLICSDVIEHVKDPDWLLAYLQLWVGSRYVISTPDRDLVDAGMSEGPPRNPHHMREWNHDELVEYLSSAGFKIISTIKRATTIVEATL